MTRAPAPTPVCRGVPGTMIFFELPLDVCAARASSCALFALLSRKKRGAISAIGSSPLVSHIDKCEWDGDNSLLSLPRHLGLELCALGELPVGLPPLAPLVEVLLLHRVEDGTELSCPCSREPRRSDDTRKRTHRASKRPRRLLVSYTPSMSRSARDTRHTSACLRTNSHENEMPACSISTLTA